jgi:TPR repeat protein
LCYKGDVFSGGFGCERNDARSLEFARESSGRGSRYGQFTLGLLHRWGRGALAKDVAQGVALYRLAAAQGLDGAQFQLGELYFSGYADMARDLAGSLRWYQLAAAQGHPEAFYWVAFCHETGEGVRKNKAEAIRWYRRAQAAGNPAAAHKLQQLGA